MIEDTVFAYCFCLEFIIVITGRLLYLTLTLLIHRLHHLNRKPLIYTTELEILSTLSALGCERISIDYHYSFSSLSALAGVQYVLAEWPLNNLGL
jgi:hypothetical protein